MAKSDGKIQAGQVVEVRFKKPTGLQPRQGVVLGFKPKLVSIHGANRLDVYEVLVGLEKILCALGPEGQTAFACRVQHRRQKYNHRKKEIT
jgi:hypothetical protein